MPNDLGGTWLDPVVRFPSAFFDDVIKLRRENVPDEACALLFGNIEVDGETQRINIATMRELENIVHSPVAFEIDPEVEYRIIVEETAKGNELVGILHTHPGAQFVSSVDQRFMFNADRIWKLVWLIAGDGRKGELEIGAYIIKSGKITRITVDYF